MTEITINNFSKNRKFGVGYSFTPTGETAHSIQDPGIDYTGTYKQCSLQMEQDRTFQTHRTTAFHKVRWFYEGRMITHTWGGWYDEDKNDFVAGWVRGFDPAFVTDNEIKIRVA